MSEIKSINASGQGKANSEFLQDNVAAAKFGISGVGENLPEVSPVPRLAKYEIAVHTDGINNTHIICGKDRENHMFSGYSTDHKAGAIDIVVGLDGSSLETNNGVMKRRKVNKNFKRDAARIYISRKTDIDAYLNCEEGDISRARSAIAIKADDVRMVARNDIKLITGHDSINSAGKRITTVGRIELIGGKGRLEPLVKGDQLIQFLSEIVDIMKQNLDIFNNYVTTELGIYKLINMHVHHSPFFAEKTLQSEEHLLEMPLRCLQIGNETKIDTEFMLNRLNSMELHWLTQEKPLLSKKVRTT